MNAAPCRLETCVAQRAERLVAVVERGAVGELTDGIAASSGIEAASVRRLAALWLGSLGKGAVRRWLEAMGAGKREPWPRVGVVAPGNLFVATWTAMLEPWLCGCEVRLRPGSGDPLAAGRLAAALGYDGFELRAFGRTDLSGWEAFFDGLGAVAVYGGDKAVAAIGAIADALGFEGELRGHGHKVTALRCSAEALGRSATEIARDSLLGDGRGCMSLRALVIDGEFELDEGWRARFAQVARELPAGRLATDLMAARRLLVEGFRMHAALGAPVELFELGDAVILVDRRRREAIEPANLGPGARVLTLLAPAPFSPALRARLARPDATVAELGRLQAPPVWRNPDGHPVGVVFQRGSRREGATPRSP